MNNSETAKQFFLMGLECLEKGDFANAEKFFTDTLELVPRSIPTLNNLAISQYEQNKIIAAKATAEMVVQIDPSNIDAYLMLATCQREQKRYEDALLTCKKIVAIDPPNAETFFSCGNILYDLKRYEEAFAAYDKALTLKPDLAAAWLGSGKALIELKRFDEASIALEKALTLEPDMGLGTSLQSLSETNYNPAVFDVVDMLTAQQIILTSEGSTTEERWKTETPYLADLISQTLKLSSDMTVLDYGCGIGRVAKELINRNGCSIVGVDMSESMRALAPEYVQSARFRVCSPQLLDDWIRQGQRFDAAISIWVLQHCLRPAEDISRIKQSLKPSAKLFILNNIWRAVPVAGGAWANDGVDIKGLLKDQFALLQDGRLPPDKTAALARLHFWAVLSNQMPS